MFTFKSLVVLVLCLHLQTLVRSAANLTDVERVLSELDTAVEEALAIIRVMEDPLWNTSKATVAQQTANNVTAEINYLKRVLVNITALTANVTSTDECFGDIYELLNTTTPREVGRREDEYFSTLYQLAFDEEMNVKKVHKELSDAFETHCIKDVTNCEGTANMILAEVARRLSKNKIVAFTLFIDVYVLTFQAEANLAGYRSELLEDFFKVLQRATACLLGKIRYEESSIPINHESISDSYIQLQAVVNAARAQSTSNLVFNLNEVMVQCTIEYNHIVTNVTYSIYYAMDIIRLMSSLAATVQPNVTDSCHVDTDRFATKDSDDLERVKAALYTILGLAIDIITDTAREAESIGLEVVDCVGQCDYLASKIERKMVEIPQNIRKIELETMVEMALMPMALRAGGGKALRNTADQMLVVVDELNLCFQYFMRV